MKPALPTAARATVEHLARPGRLASTLAVQADKTGDELMSSRESQLVDTGRVPGQRRGGNSFRLLDRLAALDLLGALRRRILDGVPYLGASAGANLACPTIRTTNDMPIVNPGSFGGLGLIPFQINAHYPQGEMAEPHASDNRQRQILGFLEENDVPVLGLPEGTWLRQGTGHQSAATHLNPTRTCGTKVCGPAWMRRWPDERRPAGH